MTKEALYEKGETPITYSQEALCRRQVMIQKSPPQYKGSVGMGEDWQGMLKRLPSNWQEQAVKRGRVATRAQTGPGDRFAASTAGVCRVWVFLSAVGAVGNAGGSGVLIGTSVAQAGGACPGVDRLALGSPDWVASGTRLVAQHQRTHPVGGWQSSPGESRKRRRRAHALRL